MKKQLYAISLLTISFTATRGIKADTDNDIKANLTELRAQAKEEKWTFTVGESNVLKQTPEHRTGLIVPDNWREHARFAPRMSAAAATPLPSRWDWRERGAVTPIKDQGSCGSCWAFGTIAAFESAVMIATGQSLSLSEQQLVSCSSYGSCSGGYYAFGFYEKTGANYTSDFAYSATNRSCKSAAQNEKLVDWSYVGSENDEPTTEEIKRAIFEHGVVATTVSAGGAFMYYKSGIYNSCTYGSTDHLVALVGWDDATQTWIVKNSWGKSWGEEGYMRMKYTDSRGRKCNNIGETAAFAVYNPKK